MNNPDMIPMTVDGLDFAVNVDDNGSYFRVSVYLAGCFLGYKDIGPLVDQGPGTMRYIVKSVFEGANYGLSKKTIEA